jgi:hypothetical protein
MTKKEFTAEQISEGLGASRMAMHVHELIAETPLKGFLKDKSSKKYLDKNGFIDDDKVIDDKTIGRKEAFAIGALQMAMLLEKMVDNKFDDYVNKEWREAILSFMEKKIVDKHTTPEKKEAKCTKRCKIEYDGETIISIGYNNKSDLLISLVEQLSKMKDISEDMKAEIIITAMKKAI